MEREIKCRKATSCQQNRPNPRSGASRFAQAGPSVFDFCVIGKAAEWSENLGIAFIAAVLPVSANPIKYVPQPPERLFKSIPTKTGELCENVAERLFQVTIDPGERYVWEIGGDAEVHGKIAEIIDSANETLWIKADAPFLRRHQTNLRTATERGGACGS